MSNWRKKKKECQVKQKDWNIESLYWEEKKLRIDSL